MQDSFKIRVDPTAGGYTDCVNVRRVLKNFFKCTCFRMMGPNVVNYKGVAGSVFYPVLVGRD
jgi:hypothetical protein